MPDASIYQHTPALACEVDMRTLAGGDPFERGGSNVTLSASAGLYWDVPAFLHGYASRAGSDLAAIINAAWSAASGSGTFSVGIDADDLFYIENSTTDFHIDFCGEVYGSMTLDTVAGGSAPYRHTSLTAWQRGCILPTDDGTKLTLTQAGGAVTDEVIISSNGIGVQSLPTWIRVRGSESDADDVWDGLTLEDAEGSSAGDPTWLVGPDGKVVCTYDSGDSDIDWLDAPTMRLLGFDGSEAAATSGGRKYVTATYQTPLMLCPSRQLLACEPVVDDDVDVSRMADGTHASSAQGPFTLYRVALRVDGRVGSRHDLDVHLRRFLAAARPGRWLTLYPQWGDMDGTSEGAIDVRRHREAWDVLTYSSTVVGYSDAYTQEEAARIAPTRCGGRLMLQRAERDEQRRVLGWGAEIAQYRDVTMLCSVDGSR